MRWGVDINPLLVLDAITGEKLAVKPVAASP